MTEDVRYADEAALEAVITQAWQEVLDLERVDPEASFFEAGGDSVQLATVRNLLREEFPSYPFPLLELFRHPTVRGLAAYLSERVEA